MAGGIVGSEEGDDVGARGDGAVEGFDDGGAPGAG